jgi:hypothetical protein
VRNSDFRFYFQFHFPSNLFFGVKCSINLFFAVKSGILWAGMERGTSQLTFLTARPLWPLLLVVVCTPPLPFVFFLQKYCIIN